MSGTHRPSHQRDLWAKAKDGDREAHDALVASFDRLAVHFADRYRNMGLHMDDLVAEAKLAVVRACQAYDPRKGASITYYVARSIRFALCNALTQHGRLVRVPRNGQHALNHGSAQTCSLDQPLDPDADTTLADTLPDPHTVPPDIALDQEEARALLRRTVASLPPKLHATIQARYGLDGSTPLTLSELARANGISHQAVQQQEARSLALLRKRLAPYLPHHDPLPTLSRPHAATQVHRRPRAGSPTR